MRLTSSEGDVPAMAEADAMAAPIQALAALRTSVRLTESDFASTSSDMQLNGVIWSITVRRVAIFGLPVDFCKHLRRH